MEVRARAVRALSRFRDPAAQEGLVAALKDENAEVRAAAAAGLGELELKAAPARASSTPPGTRAPRSGSRPPRRSGRSATPKAVPQLKALLEDADADVRGSGRRGALRDPRRHRAPGAHRRDAEQGRHRPPRRGPGARPEGLMLRLVGTWALVLLASAGAARARDHPGTGHTRMRSFTGSPGPAGRVRRPRGARGAPRRGRRGSAPSRWTGSVRAAGTGRQRLAGEEPRPRRKGTGEDAGGPWRSSARRWGSPGPACAAPRRSGSATVRHPEALSRLTGALRSPTPPCARPRPTGWACTAKAPAARAGGGAARRDAGRGHRRGLGARAPEDARNTPRSGAALQHADAGVRRAAAEALGASEDPRGTGAAAGAATGSGRRGPGGGGLGAGHIEDRMGCRHSLALAKDRDPEVRTAALQPPWRAWRTPRHWTSRGPRSATPCPRCAWRRSAPSPRIEDPRTLSPLSSAPGRCRAARSGRRPRGRWAGSRSPQGGPGPLAGGEGPGAGGPGGGGGGARRAGAGREALRPRCSTPPATRWPRSAPRPPRRSGPIPATRPQRAGSRR